MCRDAQHACYIHVQSRCRCFFQMQKKQASTSLCASRSPAHSPQQKVFRCIHFEFFAASQWTRRDHYFPAQIARKCSGTRRNRVRRTSSPSAGKTALMGGETGQWANTSRIFKVILPLWTQSVRKGRDDGSAGASAGVCGRFRCEDDRKKCGRSRCAVAAMPAETAEKLFLDDAEKRKHYNAKWKHNNNFSRESKNVSCEIWPFALNTWRSFQNMPSAWRW